MKIPYSLLLCLLPLIAWAEDPIIVGTIEKKKTIIKLFDVDANDNLLINNQFGQVSVGLWDKSEIRIQITVTANSDSDERVKRYLGAVTIDEKREGNQISIRTIFAQNTTSNWNVSSWKSDGERNFVKIDYDVMMPRQNALSVRNKFGNTSIPTFHAPLTVHSRNGNFNADKLTGIHNNIDFAYGKAYIRDLNQGKLDMAFAKLELVKANVLILNNKLAQTNIGEVGQLNADIDYSDAKIGTVHESGRIKLSYSPGFHINQLPKTAGNIDIHASYSSVALPVEDSNSCNFDVTVSYGDFNYTSGPTMHFTTQPGDNSSRGPRLTKQYIGKVGSGSGTRVHVVAKFGNVSFK